MLALLVIQIPIFLCFLGLIIPSVSGALSLKWSDATKGEITGDCADLSDACRAPLDIESNFNKCANNLGWGCELTGYNFTAVMPISCNLADKGTWASNFDNGDFNGLLITGFSLHYQSKDATAPKCDTPIVTFSTTAKATESQSCVATEGQQVIDVLRVSEDGVMIEADIEAIASLSVAVFASAVESTEPAATEPTTTEPAATVASRASTLKPCSIKDISGEIRVTKVIQGKNGGGDNTDGGSATGADGASCLLQLRVSSFILAMIGLIFSHSMF